MREYALVSDHSGPCSIIATHASLSDAIQAAREMDTDAAPTHLEDRIGYDATEDRNDAGLLEAAAAAGWRVVASADAPEERWTVLARATEKGES